MSITLVCHIVRIPVGRRISRRVVSNCREVESIVMNCYYHTNRQAVAQCPDCGKGLCKECASKYEKPICTPCNKKRGKEGIKTYVMPIMVCALLFGLGCFAGWKMGEMPLVMGYIFTCVYGGWNIVGLLFSNVFISLNIQSIIFYYGLRILLSVIVGVFATPIYLGYCIFKLFQFYFMK